MSNSRFVHLHVHTEFSLADSTIRVPAKPDQADPKKAKQANLLSRAVDLAFLVPAFQAACPGITLRLGDDQYSLKAGDCCGFKAGGPAHQLINSGPTPLRYLEIGDRTDGDSVDYPENDLKAEMINGKWRMTNKAGEGV